MLEFSVYYQPRSLTEALELLARGDKKLRPLAGGTDIVPALEKQELEADGLVDLSKIPELSQISIDSDIVKIGSTCCFSKIENSAEINTWAPLLAEAAAQVGSPQIRNLGTVGGNIANASPAADTVTALTALEATVTLASLKETRELPVSQLLCGAGKTRIEPGEIITQVCFKKPPAGSFSGFIKLGRRKALAIARMNLGMIVNIKGGIIGYARVALGAVGPNPSRNTALEELLVGQKPSSALIRDFAGEAERQVAQALGARATAAYKSQAVKGIGRELLGRLLAEVVD